MTSSKKSKNNNNNTSAKKLIPSKNDFWFLPLGGSNEIGMNLNLFGTNGQWLIVDLGVTFHDRLGIEVLTPDPSFLIQHKEEIAGLVLTHAHEDHIGAIPYLWPYLECPIYATPFTAEIVRNKIADKSWKDEVRIIEIPLSSTFKLKDFEIEFVSITHSILEPNALRITTPHGTVMHSGDWKIDPNPLVGEITDSHRFQEIGKQGVLALVCDSTNVFNEGTAGSELNVKQELTRLMKQYKNHRLSIACFASNIARVDTIVKAAAENNRKVALVGRSLHRMTQAAKDCGYLKDMPRLISDREAMDLPDHEVCFITTGSQGENKAALSRIATGAHPIVSLGDNDVVFFSSRMIPGNEKNISALQNALIHQGVRVITSSEEDIHVSGHPARDELRQMYEWIKPDVLIPVHGDAYHLDEHARFALECGVEAVIVPENGSVIQLKKDEVDEVNFIGSGRWGYDGNRMVPMSSSLLKERQKMSIEGLIVATVMTNHSGVLLQEPIFTIQGVCQDRNELELISKELRHVCHNILSTEFSSEAAQRTALEQSLRKTASRLFGKKPYVAAHIMVSSS